MILKFLKENTDRIHHQVEQHSLAKFIIDHTISKSTYQQFLIQNFNFYHTIEQALIDQRSIIDPAIHPYLSDKKSQNLKKDLTALGHPIDVNISQKYDFQILTENAAIGALYVSEGSVLGGLVISKHLAACPNLETIQQHHFFGSDVPATLGRWKNFRQVIEQHFKDEEKNRKEALASAIKTFELFGQIMQEE